MDDNSLMTNRQIELSGAKRRRREIVFTVYEDRPHLALTDRQVLIILFPNSDDVNKVQPRISELLKEGLIEKIGKAKDLHTGQAVRLCQVRTEPQKQQSLFK